MRLCACGHPETLHAEEGAGYCFGSKKNGEACECEGFRSRSQEGAATLALLEGEIQFIERLLGEVVQAYRHRFGELPWTVVITPHVAFVLAFDGGKWVYRLRGQVEINGVTVRFWEIPA